MAIAKQPVSVDGIEFDALIEQSSDYEAQVPEYPTEEGFSVSDNISLKPEVISMILYVTDTPVTWAKRFGTGFGRVDSVVKKLENLYFSKKVISVVTSDAVYDNMAITNMSITKNTDTGYAREIPITLKKIIVTKSNTVTIPASYGKSGTTEASAGSANTSGNSSSSSTNSSSSNDSEKDGSILYNVGKSVGLI